jgi:hypothetical protein
VKRALAEADQSAQWRILADAVISGPTNEFSPPDQPRETKRVFVQHWAFLCSAGWEARAVDGTRLLIYIEEVLSEIEDLLEYAGLLRQKFDAKR